MLPNDLILDNADGSDVTYRLFKPELNGSQRIDMTTNQSAPAIMAVRHSVQGKGNLAIDRHLVQISRTIVDTSSVPHTLVCNFTVAVPRNAVVTPTIVKNAIQNLLDFFSDGSLTTLPTSLNIEALLRGES